MRARDVQRNLSPAPERWERPTQVYAWLRRIGMRKIGSGMYSTVFAKPGARYVVKVTDTAHERGWAAYAEFVERTKWRHLPRIRHITTYGGKYSIAMVEKLVHLKAVPGLRSLSPDNKGLLTWCWYESESEGDYDPYLSAAWGIRGPMDDMAEYRLREKWVTLSSRWQRRNAMMLDNLEDVVRQNKLSWDLHPGNIMFRPSTRDIVLTDPFSGAGGSSRLLLGSDWRV